MIHLDEEVMLEMLVSESFYRGYLVDSLYVAVSRELLFLKQNVNNYYSNFSLFVKSKAFQFKPSQIIGFLDFLLKQLLQQPVGDSPVGGLTKK